MRFRRQTSKESGDERPRLRAPKRMPPTFLNSQCVIALTIVMAAGAVNDIECGGMLLRLYARRPFILMIIDWFTIYTRCDSER